MIFFILFHFTFSFQLFDFILDEPPDTLILYFKGLEEIDLLYDPGYYIIFSKFSDELYIEIDASDRGENETHYGPFSSGSGLGGVYFNKKNITLHFSNESPDPIMIGLYHTKTFGISYYPPDYDLEFPILDDSELFEKIRYGFTNLKILWFIILKKKSSYTPILAVTIILAVLSIYGITPICQFKWTDFYPKLFKQLYVIFIKFVQMSFKFPIHNF